MTSKTLPKEKELSADLTPPVESAGDHLQTAIRAAVSVVPYVGSPAAELFDSIIVPPYRKRHHQWMEDVAEAVRKLEESQQCVVDNLRNNNVFIDTVLQASQAAVRTSNEEKRRALRNAVLNAALPRPPDEAKRQMFVNLVDTLTDWHLKILELFADPPRWFETHHKPLPQWHLTGSISKLLATAYPELQNQREFYEILGNDLHQRGLITTDNFYLNMSAQAPLEKHTTRFADEFLAFISDPCSDK